MTKVAVVIGGNSAHINPYIFSIFGGKCFFALGEGVINFHAVITGWTMNLLV
jgi:hypothetical protein